MGYQENMDYLYRMFPYAKAAAAGTSLPVSFILTQWAHESGFGTSNFAQNGNNHAGINYSAGNSICEGTMDGRHCRYTSIEQFVQDYIRVMNLSFYSSVRSAGSGEAAIAAIGKTPYAEDPSYTPALKSLFDSYGVVGFDTYQGGGTSGGSSVTIPKIDGKYAAVAGALIGAYMLVAAFKED